MALNSLFKRTFGSRNDRLLNKMKRYVQQINNLEPELKKLSDSALAEKTNVFRSRLKNGESLDQLLVEAFATVRETSRRTLGMRHFDVQLIGGMTLHQGKIAEMGTGEGKTLAATLAVYLNALTGKGVHIVTVNDYLAKRDADWMAPIYQFHDLTVATVLPNMSHTEKKNAYQADIVYATNNELGFDFLRDNMVYNLDQKNQRPLSFAIIDEVDSILIDEARTPLIISGPVNEDASTCSIINNLVPKLKLQKEDDDIPGDYTLDEKSSQVFLTETGHQNVESLLKKSGLLLPNENLYDVKNIALMHYLNAAMRAHFLFKRDIHYIVKDQQVIIVDEHTGRTMEGRRWSDGLHQAIEAKENVPIQNENQTLASITFQNYFRLYEKLAGMTGTADTEAFEFQQIYGLEVVIIPTNKPVIRQDLPDQIYLTKKEKYRAVIEEIKTRHKKDQPILVGTASIESSELLSELLNKAGISHQVLNAKHHEKEAIIITQAGRPGSVTIATNMAGRGTDIVLGGNLDAELNTLKEPNQSTIEKIKHDWKIRHDIVIQAGGLHVLGTERNEARRIDNQLRGRSGRQGDPGSSQFYLALDDNLMRIFASERVAPLMKKFGMKENEVIAHPLVNRAVESAQRKVEAHNFDIRKQLLKYDDVANDQRKVIYSQRDSLMEAENIKDMIYSIQAEVINTLIDQYLPEDSFETQWDVDSLEKCLANDFNIDLPIKQWMDSEEKVSLMQPHDLADRVLTQIRHAYQAKEDQFGTPILRELEKSLMLESLDYHWKEHLAAMDHLRQGIHLRGYAQKDPIQEFKRESFTMFTHMLQTIKYDIISKLSRVIIEIKNDGAMPPNLLSSRPPPSQPIQTPTITSHPNLSSTPKKVGRNQKCPCGSGLKYKHCHGKQKK